MKLINAEYSLFKEQTQHSKTEFPVFKKFQKKNKRQQNEKVSKLSSKNWKNELLNLKFETKFSTLKHTLFFCL